MPTGRGLETVLEALQQHGRVAPQDLRCRLGPEWPAHANPGNKLREGGDAGPLKELLTLHELLPPRAAESHSLSQASSIASDERTSCMARACQDCLVA